MIKNDLLYDFVCDVVSLDKRGDLMPYEIYDTIKSYNRYSALYNFKNESEEDVYENVYKRIKDQEGEKIKREIKENFDRDYKARIEARLNDLKDLDIIEDKYKDLYNQIKEMAIKKLLSNAAFREMLLKEIKKKIFQSIIIGDENNEWFDISKKIEDGVIEQLMQNSNYISKLEDKVINRIAGDMFK